jgi:hypothetical protein
LLLELCSREVDADPDLGGGEAAVGVKGRCRQSYLGQDDLQPAGRDIVAHIPDRLQDEPRWRMVTGR